LGDGRAQAGWRWSIHLDGEAKLLPVESRGAQRDAGPIEDAGCTGVKVDRTHCDGEWTRRIGYRLTGAKRVLSALFKSLCWHVWLAGHPIEKETPAL
jgi:hypothetical protein